MKWVIKKNEIMGGKWIIESDKINERKWIIPVYKITKIKARFYAKILIDKKNNFLPNIIFLF